MRMATPEQLVLALKTLADAGASDRLLAQAARELVSPRPTAPPPLTPPAEPVTKASPNPAPARQPSSPAHKPVPAGNEVVNIRLPDGQRSSVSFSAGVWADLVQRFGDADLARAAIRKEASNLPPDAQNRSQWLRNRIFVLEPQGATAAAS